MRHPQELGNPIPYMVRDCSPDGFDGYTVIGRRSVACRNIHRYPHLERRRHSHQISGRSVKKNTHVKYSFCMLIFCTHPSANLCRPAAFGVPVWGEVMQAPDRPIRALGATLRRWFLPLQRSHSTCSVLLLFVLFARRCCFVSRKETSL